MIEVEIKARLREDTLQRIKALGAVPIGTEHHRDIYFNSPIRDFKASDEALRIRVKEEGARLTYKGPKLDSETKSRKELTVKIDDSESMMQILLSLGFVISGEVIKSRTKYTLGDIIFAMDDVSGLGSFLEIEIAGGDDWPEKKRMLQDIMTELGLDESIRKSYLELLLECEGGDKGK
ncbi:MAG: class IV adenylate cyclase [Methanotrichaceae archaeon]